MIKKIFLTILGTTICWSTWANSGLFEAAAAYHRGDYAEVIKIVRPAAEKGDAWAMRLLGIAYNNGEGVPQDNVAAVYWFTLAANRGDVPSQHNLGIAYQNGKGTPQNYSEALKWYRLSAIQGIPESQGNLGTLYAMGHGVPQDFLKAHMWLNLASAAGDTHAEKNRNIVAGRMPPQQILEAQKMARDCLARKFKDCD
jgi:TPR repeat protein